MGDIRAGSSHTASPKRGEPYCAAVLYAYFLFLRTQKVVRKQVSAQKEGDYRARI